MRKRKKVEKKKLGKEELLNTLNKLRPGLASKPIVEELQHFHFCNDSVSTYNEDILMRATLKTGIECSVNAERFLKLLSGIRGEEIEFEKKKGELIIEGETASFGLAYSELGEVFGKIEGVEIKKPKKVEKEFIDGLRLCSFSASKDAGDLLLSNICVSGNSILSSDRARCSWFEAEEEYPKMLIPSFSITKIIGQDFEKFACDDTWLHLIGDVEFSCLLKGGDYPSSRVKEFFPEEYPKGYDLPKELEGALGSAEVLMDKDFILDKEAKFYFEKDRLIVEAEKEDLGWFSEEIPLKDGPKKEFMFKVNPVFMREVMKVSRDSKFHPAKDLVLLVNRNFKHIISL